jgi:hypothetical protein
MYANAYISAQNRKLALANKYYQQLINSFKLNLIYTEYVWNYLYLIQSYVYIIREVQLSGEEFLLLLNMRNNKYKLC